MRKIILMFISITSLTAFSQRHDAKLHLSGLPFGNYGLGYEYVFAESFGAVGNINFSSMSPGNMSKELYGLDVGRVTYSDFSFSPEIRYYKDVDYDGDGVFYGLYFRYKAFDYESDGLADGYDYEGGSGSYSVNHSANQLFLGGTYGYKNVTDYGLFFETYLGLGFALKNNIKFKDPQAQASYTSYSENAATMDLPYYHPSIDSFDFRFAISVGWRFNKE